MRKNSLILILVTIFISVISLKAQNLIQNPSDIAICYGSNKVNKIYIPPSKEFYERKGTNGALIQVNYNGFPADAKAAMQFAVSIWSSLLPRDVKITINATWQIINEAGVLARTSITSYYLGSFIDAWKPFAYYPVALAEKIAATNLNSDTEAELEISLNRRARWYTGTDGNTPTDNYDLVTVIIHEMCHGLGFTTSMNSNDTIGWYGFNNIPLIYDTFIENLNGERLTDTLKFKNYSTDLYGTLTSGKIFFNGPLLMNYTSGKRAGLNAPSNWIEGSSISHLDEQTIQADALMTPFIDFGEAIHNPGKLTLSILGDVGWVNTKIFHTPIKDTEAHLSEVTFSAKIKSDTLFNHDNVGLVYSFDKFVSKDTLYLTSPAANDSFKIKLNIPSYSTTVSYYFFVRDYFKREYKLPSPGAQSPYRFYIGPDTIKPVLFHKPLENFTEDVETINFTTSATDNVGIDTVYIEYKVNNGASMYFGLSHDSLSIYSKILNVKSFALKAGDSIQYRITAIDRANIPNYKKMPASGYYSIHIKKIMTVVDSYITNFNSKNEDFANTGFSITQPEFFTTPALHTKHPYESPDIDDQSLEYTSVLMHPLKVDETGMIISFKEIVLIEPGETGSVFGSADFYDYVIVEGSKDHGKTWLYLANGYDSRIATSFLNTYNSSVTGMNSNAVGKENMYLRHTIDLRNITMIGKGDTIMVRFRLYSDPYAHGWGWAIDDLSITSVATPVEKIFSYPVRVYPNPGNGLIKIDPGEIAYGKLVPFKIFNSTGSQIFSGNLNGGSLNTIDITNQSTGLYIIVLYKDGGIMTIKYSLIKN